MEVSRSQGHHEQWQTTSASSSERPGEGRTRGITKGRKRAGEARGPCEAWSPEVARGPGPPD
eukprot:13181193-Heterocapsa_arctica.AAC.1